MNKNHIAGLFSHVLGSVKMTTATIVGNRGLESRGFAQRIAGTAQWSVGDARQLIKSCIERQCQSA